ncbi:Ecdysteroid 22-kinase [Operophtera brumata]|uniref:Ecdysteroid 22-kinase n=1 Tax=Operophtera brumata TaxID=104452 RepID=A0A0L7LPX6_OPEBR|nr:Ecdysteroid 22-kinase [Operophtera brumata]
MSDTEQKVRDLLHNIAKEQKFQNYDLKVSPISTGGANYSSLLYIATISSMDKDDLHLFVKVAAMSKQMREQVSMAVYETEKVVYTDLKDAYREIEKKHQIPEEHWLYLPKYYGANTTLMEEMLVLENMAVKGFVTHDRFKSIDWEYASKAVTELAKLHSLSIAFQRDYPEEFHRIKNKYISEWMTEDMIKTFWGNGAKSALEVLTNENKVKFKKFADKIDFAAFMKHYVPLRVEVITHGDYRPSNLMHRTLKVSMSYIKLVDHQTIQIGSPVIDLLYLIFTGTDKEFRDKFYEKLVEFYYTQLSDAMKRLGIDPEKTYSREDFYFELKQKLPHGLIAATYTLPYITVETEKAPELNSEMDLSSFGLTETGNLYPKRINGVVSDFIRWGIRDRAMADIEERMRDLLRKIAREQQYENYDLQITPISSGGANYSSTLYVAKITSKTKNTLDLFIKISQIGARVREDFKITIFETERFIYRDMRKAYMEIEEKHKVPEEHRIYIAKYYGADLTPPDEMLVLENLAIRGFVIHDRFKSIDWEYATTAVNELAKLHSLSMAFQREYPEEFKHFSENYQYEWLNEWTLNSLWLPGFKKAIAVAPEEHKDKLKKFFDKYDIEKISRQYVPLRCKVLTHGDYRPSNLMHRTRDDGSLEIIVVDHQTIQIGCPITDLMYLIFTGTDKPFRDQYFDKLIDHYYTRLSEAMKRLDIDPETTYSRADFDFEIKEKLPFGLTVAAFVLPIVTVETENAPEMKPDMDLSNFAVLENGALFPDRINGVVDDYVKWDVLKD